MLKDPINSLKKRLEKKLAVRFRKPLLFEAAFQHPSYRNEHPSDLAEDFDRLEFFGDAILNYVICRQLFKIFPKEHEGMLSRLRSILVSRKILCRIAKDLGFLRLIKLGKSLRMQKGYSKTKLLADAFESFLAAFFFDQGLAKTEQFILKHFEAYFSIKRLFRLDPNPKSMLQEICQKKWQRLPVYTTTSGPHGVKTVVAAHRNKKAMAYGKTRRETEEKAARLLLKKLRQEETFPGLKTSSSGMKLRKIL